MVDISVNVLAKLSRRIETGKLPFIVCYQMKMELSTATHSPIILKFLRTICKYRQSIVSNGMKVSVKAKGDLW